MEKFAVYIVLCWLKILHFVANLFYVDFKWYNLFQMYSKIGWKCGFKMVKLAGKCCFMLT